MKILYMIPTSIFKIVVLTILLGSTFFANASSDNVKVVCSSPHSMLNSNKTRTDVIALVSMDEVMPECAQHIVQGPVESLTYSESGISVNTMSFKWHEANMSVITNIGENPVLNIDDIRSASQFIQIGKHYLIHFQLCHGTEPTLISMYSLNNPTKNSRKSKLKPLNRVI